MTLEKIALNRALIKQITDPKTHIRAFTRTDLVYIDLHNTIYSGNAMKYCISLSQQLLFTTYFWRMVNNGSFSLSLLSLSLSLSLSFLLLFLSNELLQIFYTFWRTLISAYIYFLFGLSCLDIFISFPFDKVTLYLLQVLSGFQPL